VAQYIWLVDKIIGGLVLKNIYFLAAMSDSRAEAGKM
jgi:hypothetical protein